MSLSSSSSLACPTTGEKQGWRCSVTWELLEPVLCGEIILQPKSHGIPDSQQTAALPPRCQLLLAAGALVPSLGSIQPPSNLSPSRDKRIVPCPMRSKRECVLLCDIDIFISFRLFPSASQTPQGSQGTPSPSLLLGDQEPGNWDKSIFHISSSLGLPSPVLTWCPQVQAEGQVSQLAVGGTAAELVSSPCSSHKYLEG